MNRAMLVALLVTAVACSRQEVAEKKDQSVESARNAVGEVQDALDVSAPTGAGPTREEIERERLNQEWRQQRSFQEAAARRRAAQAQANPATPLPPAPDLAFVNDPKFDEKLKGVNPAAIAAMPIRVPIKGDVNGPSVLKAQVLLDRANYSVGPIDGRWGKNSEIAVYWFQEQHGIEPTGDVDEATFRAIAAAAGSAPALTNYTVTADDTKGPFVTIPEGVYEQAKLDCMCYESIAEKIAERFHTTIETLDLLNPQVRLDDLRAGQTILAPHVRKPAAESAPNDIARIAISIKGNYFHGHDASGNIVFHAPTTLGSKYDPSPTETLKVVRTAFNPQFKYQPKLFAEVPDDEPEADLQPGPNSPVGVVWMALSKPHYGIHGTRDPDSIGYASSHGCVRLTNWDAVDVARRTAEGTQVEFVDPRH